MTSAFKANSSQIYLITAVASLGGLLFGYDTAVISGAVGSLNNFFIKAISNDLAASESAITEFKAIITLCTLVVIALSSSFILRFYKRSTAFAIITGLVAVIGAYFYFEFLRVPPVLTENLKNSILGFMVSSALVGCIIGAAAGDRIANSMGRRNGLLLSAILFIISACGSGYPEAMNIFTTSSLTSFIIYRIIGGVGVGLASMLAPLYIAEMAPANIRGKLVSCNQFAIVSGMLVVYFVNYYIVKGQTTEWIDSDGWRYMFLSENIPAVLFLFFLLFVPKTPRFQVLKGREEEALQTLSKLNGNDKAPGILQDIKNSFDVKKAHWLTYGWGVVIIGILLSVFQQFVGINVVLYYAPEIFKGMNVGNDASMVQTIIVGIINMLFTVLAIFTVDNFGRKKLMLIGSVCMAVSMLGLGFSLYLQSDPIASLLLMLFYIAAFAMSWGPITWVLLAEIFPNKIKGVMAVAVAAQWLANLVVSWTFPLMNNNTGLTEMFNHGFSYWIYGIMALLSAIFIWKFVPETKGKALEEIEHLWLGKK